MAIHSNAATQKNRTPQTILADAMDLPAEDRAQLARWLSLCVRMDLQLEPESVRKASERDLRSIFGGFQ